MNPFCVRSALDVFLLSTLSSQLSIFGRKATKNAGAVGLEPTSQYLAACFRDRFLIQAG
jgi:hypothetical protein